MVTVLCVCLTTKMLFALLMLKCIKVTSNSGSLMTNRRLLHQLYRAGERRRWQNQMYLWWITTTRQLFSSFFVLLIYLTTCTKNWWALLCCDYFVSCFWIIIQQLWIYHIISTALNIQLYTFMMIKRNVLITSIIAHMKYKKEWKIISVVWWI